MRVKFLARLGNRHRDDDELVEGQMFSWPAVKEVKLSSVVWCDQMVAELGILFPNLCSLEVSFYKGDRKSRVPFRQLWSSFPFLEKLVIDG